MLDCSSAMPHYNKAEVDWHDVKFGDDGDKLNNFSFMPITILISIRVEVDLQPPYQ